MRRAKDHPDIRPLSHIGLDAVLGRPQLAELALHTDVITVSRASTLATAGRVVREFVAIIDGLVDVTHRSQRTYVAGPGTHIGGSELVERRAHDASFVTRSDCHLVVIAGHALAATFHHPGVADWIEQRSERGRHNAAVVAPATSRALALVD